MTLALFPVAFNAAASTGATLTVTLEGGAPGEGEFVVGLFDADDKWLKEVKRETRVRVDENGNAVVSFEDLPSGRFAISTYQDRNENGKIDTFLGIPREPYAFSNGARGTFGPAKFDEAAFDFGDEDQGLEIRFP
jgi:uncharacterized protein (DUF2141 family)